MNIFRRQSMWEKVADRAVQRSAQAGNQGQRDYHRHPPRGGARQCRNLIRQGQAREVMMLAGIAGLAIGYVLGTKAGRERYEQIVAAANKLAPRLEAYGAGGSFAKESHSLQPGLPPSLNLTIPLRCPTARSSRHPSWRGSLGSSSSLLKAP